MTSLPDKPLDTSMPDGHAGITRQANRAIKTDTMQTTANEYAKDHGISITTARKQLAKLVEEGKAKVSHNVIIYQRVRKTGARSHMVSIRGNLYVIS
jgi:predicted ArsR family transcriptional regulator